MDLLSRAFEELGLLRAAFHRVEARGSRWALEVEDGVRGLYVVEAGAAELGIDGRRAALAAGDLLLVLSGAAHQLRAVGVRARGTAGSARRVAAGPRAEGPLVLGAPGEAPSCTLLRGTFELEASDHPMLSSLGWVLLRRDTIVGSARLSGWTTALREEAGAPGPGAEAMRARLSELLLIEALRVQGETAGECPAGGWFRGLRDPALSRALSAFHQDIAAPWTVESLARVAGQSRSAFASRFPAMLGESPLGYVRRWRLFHARRLLRGTTRSLEEIAQAVGYGSAAALSLAFTRESGESPGEWRARHRRGQEPV